MSRRSVPAPSTNFFYAIMHQNHLAPTLEGVLSMNDQKSTAIHKHVDPLSSTIKYDPKASLLLPAPESIVVITDSEGSVIDCSLEYLGDGAYRVKFSHSVSPEDLECSIKWNEEE